MRHPALVIAVLVLSGLAVVSQLYLPLPLFEAIADDYEVSTGAAGLVSTVFGVAYASGFLFFGPLSDRFGRKAVMVPGLAALALSSLLVAFLPGFGWVLAARALQGFVAATLPPVALAYLPEQLPDRLKVFGIACMSAAFLLAGLLGQLYGGALGSLSAAVLPLVVVYAIAAVLVLLLPESVKESSSTSDGGLFSVYRGMGGLLTEGALVRAYGGTLVLLFGFVGFYASAGLFAGESIERAGLDLTTVRAAAVPAMLLALAAPRFISRYGPRTVVWAGFATGSAGLLAAAAVTAVTGLGDVTAIWRLVAASVVFVAGVSLAVPSVIALVGSLAPEKRGAAVALYAFILFIGASLGPQFPPLVSGFVASQGAGLIVVCVALGVLFAAAAVLNASVPKRHPSAEPAGSES